LSEVTTELKKENETLRTKFQHVHSSLESEVTKLKSQLEARDVQVNSLREEMRSSASEKSEKYFRELSLEKEKLLHLQSELSTKFETEKLGTEKRHREVW
jgi:transcription initiation factor TFIID subunit TAF12